MASAKEISATQKSHLTSLLKVKRSYVKSPVAHEVQAVLDEEIQNAVAVMDKEDVAWCEKIIGVKAL